MAGMRAAIDAGRFADFHAATMAGWADMGDSSWPLFRRYVRTCCFSAT